MLNASVVRAAADFGSRPAYITSEGWSVSFAELDRAADEVAAALRAEGISDRATVGLVMESTVDFVVVYVALARIGAVTAGVNPRFTPP